MRPTRPDREHERNDHKHETAKPNPSQQFFSPMNLRLMKIHKKRRETMSTTEVVKPSNEYMNVPIAELIESSTNPRKVFDQSFIEELAESIRNRGILSPLLVRPVN